MVRVIGEPTEDDYTHGFDTTMGCLFFSKECSCVPIFELMKTRREWEGVLISKPALMNAIWEYLPKYALIQNKQEQTGKNELVSMLAKEFGLDINPKPSAEQLICIYPEAGTDFLLLK